MRIRLFALGIIGACTLAGPAMAQNYPWCANYRVGGTNCGFSTFAQCQAALSGIGGACEENTQYTGPAKGAARPSSAGGTSRPDKPKPQAAPHEKVVAPQPQ